MFEMTLALLILGAAIALLLTEWIPMEVTALLVLVAVAVGGLVSPAEALSGFSNPAVVTVWAVFILSGGLANTGVASAIGRFVIRVAGHGEARMIAVIMSCAGAMSAFMNNVAVAALMLPVVMDIARQTGRAPSRLLMPLAFGSLLGGVTTLIGTPPNLLVSQALRENGMAPFGMFDFTPIGVGIMLAGIAFMVSIGRHLLPRTDPERQLSAHPNLMETYALRERLFLLRVPGGSPLVGQTLGSIRIGSALGLHVVGILRDGRTELAPGQGTVIDAGAGLLVEGDPGRMELVRGWCELVVEEDQHGLDRMLCDEIGVAEARLSADSPLIGRTLVESEFRQRFGFNVLAVRRGEALYRTGLAHRPLREGDVVLVQGLAQDIAAAEKVDGFADVRPVRQDDLRRVYRIDERLMLLRVAAGSTLDGRTLADSRLGDALGLRVVQICRADGEKVMPDPGECLHAGDRLLVKGKLSQLSLLRGLEALQIEKEIPLHPDILESEDVGLVEVVLSPRATLLGRTVRQLQFRERFGLSVLALWRRGRPHRTNLRDFTLEFGDALLLYGPREKLRDLAGDPDFIVLTAAAQGPGRPEKARWAMLIMGGMVVSAVAGWIPIYIAAVAAAAVMVASRCLTMEEAYRAIDWKAVFLIAGLLPLGLALDRTGAASLVANGVVDAAGARGPLAVMAALVFVTFVATCIIPTAALVVLMAPIVLSAAEGMGVSPYPMMMAMAMAASSSFTSPVAHPANVMVMGPGGYRFRDYVKVGVPLTLVVGAVILILLPLVMPFGP